MKQGIHNLRTAYRLVKSQSSIETGAAVVLVVATLGPVVWEFWKQPDAGGERR